MTDLSRVKDLFEGYYSKLEEDKRFIAEDIGKLVLTGEEILKSGIANPDKYSEADRFSSEEIKTIEEDNERLETKLEKWRGAYKKLRSLYQSQCEQSREANERLRKKLLKIDKLIHDREGEIPDEIQRIIYSK